MTDASAGTPPSGPGQHDTHQLLDALAVVFHEEAAFDPSLTTAAAGGITLLSGLLSVCVGFAQAAAIPTKAALTETMLALHVATYALANGLDHTVEALVSGRLRAVTAIGPAQAQGLRVALRRASTGLLTAAVAFADAHRELDDADDKDPSARHA